MNDREINNEIKKCVEKIISETNSNILIFNRECAIQSRLYRYICKALDEWTPRHEVVFNRFKRSKKVELIEHPIKQKISRVQLEYFGGSKQAIDLAILDNDDLKNMEMFSFEKSRSKEHIKLSHAIEIKFIEGWESDKLNLLKKDIKKLRGYKNQDRAKYLHFIVIVRWPTKTLRVQKEIMDIKKRIQEDCTKKSPKIEFYTNDSKLYFYPYENKFL